MAYHNDKDWMFNLTESQEILGCSKKTLLRWIQSNRIPSSSIVHGVNRRFFIPMTTLETVLDEMVNDGSVKRSSPRYHVRNKELLEKVNAGRLWLKKWKELS